MRIAVIVNERARKGGPQAARVIRRGLPGAEVVLSRSLEDLEAFAAEVVRSPQDLVVSAGGDGSAIALLNQLRAARRRAGIPAHERMPRLGFIGLGTGNAWANVMGGPPLARAVDQLRGLSDSVDGHLGRAHSLEGIPTRGFDLLEVEGTLAHFAGTGWDAELIDDFHAQKSDVLLPRRIRYGLGGYLSALLTRSVPRNLRLPRVEVEIENLGAAALGVDARGRPFKIDPPDRSVLYRGPVGVCSAGTTNEWGFGFRAFPFAGLVPGRMNLRMYTGTATEALARTPLLWTGKHPLDKMLTWLVTRCSVKLSRIVPFQVGGDLFGHRDRIEYGVATERVEVLDWRALADRLAPESRLLTAFLGAATPTLERH